MERAEIYRKGYVRGPFRIFYLKSALEEEIALHFHDFRKLVIVLQGQLFYDIEGRRYELGPGDLVLVDAGELHRPVFSAGGETAYERVVIYFSQEFFKLHEEAQLDACFGMLGQGMSHVLHVSWLPEEIRSDKIRGMAERFSDHPAATSLLQECRLIEFLLYLNQSLEDQETLFREPITQNPAIRQVMQYLSEHLSEDLEIRQVAAYIHLDASYLMHLFKAETGSSIMSYVTEKRLYLARRLIREGLPAMLAAERSGFTNYSSFYRAYRKRYGSSPGRGQEKGGYPDRNHL